LASIESLPLCSQRTSLPRRALEKFGLRYLKNARFDDTDLKYYVITREEHRRDESRDVERFEKY